MSSTEIIVLEPSNKQKRYTLKPHGEVEKVQKRWRSHLKNIGASWSEKKKIWTLSREKLQDFQKIQAIMSSAKQDENKEDNEKYEKHEKEDKKKKNEKHKHVSPSSSSNSDSDEDSDDESESSSDSDEEVIEFLKNKIKNISKSTHGKVISDDMDNSEEEDVIRISRRIRFILLKLQAVEKRVSELEEENSYLHRQMSSLKK
jgi:hypothetical protein